MARGETGYFMDPTLVETKDPAYRLLCEEIFGPVVTAFVYPDAKFGEILETVNRTSPYALTGSIFARDRAAVQKAMLALRDAAGNFYINDKPTGAVVGQQPFGGARASGTNDKAGSMLNLARWVSARSVKETLRAAARLSVPVHGSGIAGGNDSPALHASAILHARRLHRSRVRRKSARGVPRRHEDPGGGAAEHRARDESVRDGVRVSAGGSDAHAPRADLHPGGRAAVRRASRRWDARTRSPRSARSRWRARRASCSRRAWARCRCSSAAQFKKPTFAQLSVAKLPEIGPPPPGRTHLAEMLSLDASDILGGMTAPQAISCGFPFLIVPLRDLDAVRRARVRMDQWDSALKSYWAPDIMVFARDAERDGASIRARVFVPGQGIIEDPATGSAVGGARRLSRRARDRGEREFPLRGRAGVRDQAAEPSRARSGQGRRRDHRRARGRRGGDGERGNHGDPASARGLSGGEALRA